MALFLPFEGEVAPMPCMTDRSSIAWRKICRRLVLDTAGHAVGDFTSTNELGYTGYCYGRRPLTLTWDPRARELWGWKNLANAQIVAIAAGGSIVDCHSRPGTRRCTALSLDPIRISHCCEVLVNHRLIRTKCPRCRIIPIITHPKYPGVVPGR